MNRTTLTLIVLFLSLTAACAPDPRKQADADATRLAAEQAALTAAQERAQDQAMHELELRQEAVRIQRIEDTAAEVTYGMTNFIRITFLFLTAGVCFVIFGFASTAYAVTRGTGEAMVMRAQLNAQLIHLDPVTRQYPLKLTYMSQGKYSLTNPNTGSVMMLDTRNAADSQMIAGMIAVQHTGVLAREAKQDVTVTQIDPPQIQPQVIDVESLMNIYQEQQR